MMVKPSASISSLTFSGGQKFSFSPKEKVILVGPNNSGKSQTLREIMEIARNGDRARCLVVNQLRFAKYGSQETLKNFLDSNASYHDGHYMYKDWSINEQLIHLWDHPYLHNSIMQGFIKNVNAEDRLTICEQQKSIGPNEQKSRPQHVLYDDSVLMETVSGLFRKAFGEDLMFDYRGGRVLPIHVGQKPDPSLTNQVGDDYVAAVRANPLLDQQGDGMKSYAGILFETIVADLDINLLDEPEAFLHPPQMRGLGETLASEVKGQLIVATHSSDIMRGFLEGTQGNVRILRIRRVGQKNIVSEAEPEVIKELWARPELRYSNALDSIFHEETIICEDDSDCRLFNALADYLAAGEDAPWKDTFYIPTGGKHGVRKVASILRNIGVPIKAIFDIDFLSERSLVKDTVEAFGGEWIDFETLWQRVDAAVRNGVSPKSVSEIKSELVSIIQASSGDALPKGDITEAMKQTSSWSMVRKHGRSGIPNGQAQTYYDDLSSLLQGIGIYLVPVGEVENFCRNLGAHGPKFVNKLLSDVPFNDDKLDELRQFTWLVHMGKHAPLPEDA